MKNKLIIIVGETGVGKDTVATLLPYKKVVSYKTGPMRDSDVDGLTHHFITEEQMDELEKQDNMIAWTKTGDIRYCATADQLIDPVMIYILNPDGVRWFKKNYKKDDMEIITIGLYESMDVRMSRCMLRKDTMLSFAKRTNNEREDHELFRKNGEFDYILRNEDSILTVNIIKSILKEHCKWRNPNE